jgi:tellurite methyltransferase
MNDTTRQRWDQRYSATLPEQRPIQVLTEYLHLLPASGQVLDLACGLGANALLLASRGLATWAWDISPVAIAQLDQAARAAGLVIHTAVRDVILQPPAAECFDVIVVSRWLERSLAPVLQAALRPGGLLFYQTFTKIRTAAARGPRNPAFLLDDNELLRLFAPLKVRVYREEGRVGDPSLGFRNAAMLVAQKG